VPAVDVREIGAPGRQLPRRGPAVLKCLRIFYPRTV
jgi:hypothetical protein